VAQITRLLFAYSPPIDNRPPAPISLGVVIDDHTVHWGDIALWDDTPPPGLSDDLESTFVGRPLNSFRELCTLQGVLPELPGRCAAGLQQALLLAVAAQASLTPAEVLAGEYGLPALKPSSITCPIFLEISDFAATAERIDQMLALRPAGIGYRLTGGRPAEAIGENAEYLQRFVRELAERIATAGGPNYRTAIYLGLNGALGVLAGDPRRQIGRVLGHCAGLQAAAGALDLYLEEPFWLEDHLAQAALLRQLKEYCRRSAAFEKQPLFVARVGADGAPADGEKPDVYGDVAAVDVLVLPAGEEQSIDELMRRVVTLGRAGVKVMLAYRAEPIYSPRRLEAAVDVALAGSAALLLSVDSGAARLPTVVNRHVAEAGAWVNRQ
jgi:methylaspartate ammonia-lyase